MAGWKSNRSFVFTDELMAHTERKKKDWASISDVYLLTKDVYHSHEKYKKLSVQYCNKATIKWYLLSSASNKVGTYVGCSAFW